jgi:hypothetical protein
MRGKFFMKIFYCFTLLCLLFYISCETAYNLPKQSFVYGYDFTKYSANGFLFTPESYNGEYDAIGLIEVEIYPEVTKDKPRDSNKWDTWNRPNLPDWYISRVSGEEVLDSLYKVTKSMGADAVVNLKVTETEPMSNGEVTFKGVRASGFAIKRK